MPLALTIVVALIFTVCGLACVVGVVLGLPGTWIMLGLAAAIELADTLYLPDDQPRTFGWGLIAACVVLALIGEGLEFLAGMLGAKKAGSSRRGAWGALIGGIVGAVVGIPLPVPLVGSLLGAVVGTFAGAILGEISGAAGSTVRDSLKPASGATIGRILGTLSKVPIAVAIWIALSIAAFWP